MELVTKKRLTLVTGRVNSELATEVAERLGVGLSEVQIAEFANGELHCRFGESIRGADLFIFQSHASTGTTSVNDAIMEQLIMVDAAKRASAKRITVVCPAFGYARQDRKSEGREPITAKLIADMFAAAGADRLISIDLHSGQIQGFFDGPVDHLTAMPVLVERLAALEGDLVVVSPDAGRVKVAERYANQLHADLAIVHKRRLKGVKNTVEALDVVGEVDGRTCVLIDDMIDTAGTIVAAADQLRDKGAAEVVAACTHGVFSGPAMDRIRASSISRLFVTDTLTMPADLPLDKIEVLSVAGVVADAIDAVFEDTSVSEIFGGANQS